MRSQSLFREADKEGDGNIVYGTIAELSAANLIDIVLGSGTRSGFLFETDGCGTDNLDIKRMTFYYIYANPRMLNGTGNRAFATNHEGVIYYTQQELIAGGVTLLVAEGIIPVGTYPIR